MKKDGEKRSVGHYDFVTGRMGGVWIIHRATGHQTILTDVEAAALGRFLVKHLGDFGEDEPELERCPHCGGSHQAGMIDLCPNNPHRHSPLPPGPQETKRPYVPLEDINKKTQAMLNEMERGKEGTN